MEDWFLQASGRAWWVGGEMPVIERVRFEPRRRYLSKEERARIVAECCRPGASLKAVARAHRVFPENLRNWVRLAGRVDEVNEHRAMAHPAFVALVLEEQAVARTGDDRGRWRCRASGCRWLGRSDRGGDGLYAAMAEIDPGLSPRIVLATRPVSFIKQLDGLAAVMEHELGLDPYRARIASICSQVNHPFCPRRASHRFQVRMTRFRNHRMRLLLPVRP